MASLSSRAKSSSSIRCCVPILVAFSRPERIQRRTVSGSRLVRRAASGTVSIVAIYYNSPRRSYRNAGQIPCFSTIVDDLKNFSRSDLQKVQADPWAKRLGFDRSVFA